MQLVKRGVDNPRGTRKKRGKGLSRSAAHHVQTEPARQNPDKGHQPALRCVAPDSLPTKDEIEAKLGPGHEGGEEGEEEGGGIVYGLKSGDLGDDSERGELGQGARPPETTASRHR